MPDAAHEAVAYLDEEDGFRCVDSHAELLVEQLVLEVGGGEVVQCLLHLYGILLGERGCQVADEVLYQLGIGLLVLLGYLGDIDEVEASHVQGIGDAPVVCLDKVVGVCIVLVFQVDDLGVFQLQSFARGGDHGMLRFFFSAQAILCSKQEQGFFLAAGAVGERQVLQVVQDFPA